MIDWSKHNPHKHAELNKTLAVNCDCGWHSREGGGYAMDQYRAHVSSLMPKHDEPPAPIDTRQRTKRSRLR